VACVLSVLIGVGGHVVFDISVGGGQFFNRKSWFVGGMGVRWVGKSMQPRRRDGREDRREGLDGGL
jgi:hypothetical protein